MIRHYISKTSCCPAGVFCPQAAQLAWADRNTVLNSTNKALNPHVRILMSLMIPHLKMFTHGSNLFQISNRRKYEYVFVQLTVLHWLKLHRGPDESYHWTRFLALLSTLTWQLSLLRKPKCSLNKTERKL